VKLLYKKGTRKRVVKLAQSSTKNVGRSKSIVSTTKTTGLAFVLKTHNFSKGVGEIFTYYLTKAG
jgi:hypothetical protein